MPKTSPQQLQENAFNLASSHLAGFNLIDASAGTGKTYTICALVLRLILEKNFSIEQILVVTYTEAATEDLRDRIRQKLRQALQVLTDMGSKDPFLQEYLPLIRDINEAKRKIADALRSFDEAAIFTIHGFCQRILLENSFESNTLFNTELVTDASYLLKEIIDDFWRQEFYRESDLFVQYAVTKMTPDNLYDFLETLLPQPMIQFIPAETAVDNTRLSSLENEYIAAYESVCRAWLKARNEVSSDLLHSKALNRSTYRQGKIPGILSAMDDMAADCRPTAFLFEGFTLLTKSTIIAKTKSKHTPNLLLFYDLCENLQLTLSILLQHYDLCLLIKKKRLADSFRNEFNSRKERHNIFSFDDLLRKLHEALSDLSGASFAKTVAGKYRAVLIDEFQDTDPLQFEIFTAICRNRSLLFLIGDPKQAIYSFRGADIFTYMDAAASRQLTRHTLSVNHRSIPGLVIAINTIFSRASRPFIFDAIVFQPVTPTPPEDKKILTLEGMQKSPFILWFLDNQRAAVDTKKLTKAEAEHKIFAAVAAEVTNLLSLAAENKALLEGRKLIPGDIAIIVRKNEEARKMQEVLTACRVPSVLHSGDNLFATWEAREMALILDAVAACENLPKVRSGLLTRLIGLGANDIDPASPDSESLIEKWRFRIRTYHEIWNRQGFIQMFWTMMAENKVRVRLLALKNGERSLTNFLHLAEILHQEAVAGGLNMTALLDYLFARIADGQAKNIEHQLRLESDADRVKIVTIHKAKGLEYPVVFCPFTWEGTRLSTRDGCIFHSRGKGPDTKPELFFDAGSSELEKHLQLATQEELAENLRLLYVALTRAIHRCYMVWGSFKGAETSAPAYLLHQGPVENSDLSENSLISHVADRYMDMTNNEILHELLYLAEASCGTISIRPCPETMTTDIMQQSNEAIQLSSRNFIGNIPRDWKICSFSSLIATRPTPGGIISETRENIPGRDDSSYERIKLEETEKLVEKQIDIFAFPRGPGPGTMLHDLLEKIDFSRIDSEKVEKLVNQKLRQYDFNPDWEPILLKMLVDLANVSLHYEIPELRFANIPAASCLHELEFYFPLARISPEDLKTIFMGEISTILSPELGESIDLIMDRLLFSPVRGFMKGFIDLIFEFHGKFYLVDWKSNYLGPAALDYHKDRLSDAMISGFYFLQYHLYCLALHLYLENRLPGYDYDTHFGGVFYVFLRGVDQRLGPDYGIFHAQPCTSMINTLKAKLIAGSKTL